MQFRFLSVNELYLHHLFRVNRLAAIKSLVEATVLGETGKQNYMDGKKSGLQFLAGIRKKGAFSLLGDSEFISYYRD